MNNLVENMATSIVSFMADTFKITVRI